MDKKLEMRQAVIDSLKYYLDKHHMVLIPVGCVQVGPGYARETREGPVKPISYEGYPCVGIVLSVGIKGQEPPEWLMDIIHRIEYFAINELNKVESKPAEEKQLCMHQWARDLTEEEVKSLNNIFYGEERNNQP